MRILLIEDDEILTNLLLKSLTQQHYVVDTATDGAFGWSCAQSAIYDLILLDVGLPKIDGITLCQRLRNEGYKTPILLMTAREEKNDRIRGLDAGADDYVLKPFDMDELQARVRALLRRGEVAPTTILQLGELQLDPQSCQVSYAEKPLNLTPKEYTLLEVFLRNPAHVFSRGQLIEHLWTFDDPPQEESVKAHIKGLRQKLKVAGAVDWIENVYGLGYRLVAKGGGSESSQQNQPATIEQQFNQSREQLWQQSHGLMVERMTVLYQAVSELEQNGTLSETVQQAARQAAHKLAGVLGMFDRPTGTELARQIEAMLLEPPLPPTDQLRKCVIDLGQLLEIAPEATLVQHQPAEIKLLIPPKAAALQTVRVLVVDDDPVFLAMLHPLLKPWSIQVTELNDPTQFWDVLPAVAPDLLLLDVEMPQVNGIEICQAVRANSQWQNLPILFLTAKRDQETIQQGFAAGADDYITKPIVGAELLTRMINRLERSRLLQTLSTKDPLTGLANQPHSSHQLGQMIAECPTAFALAVVTLVELHELNFQYGHDMTNQILQQWGRVFQSTLDNTAILGYWGNGEFLLGLPEQTLAQAEDCLADLLMTLRQQIFTAPEGDRFQVSFSLGLATYPDDGLTLHRLYQVSRSQAVMVNP